MRQSGRKVTEKGATQLCLCPQLLLSGILKASMSLTQVLLLMHWGTSSHRTLIVPKAVGMETTMVVQFESSSCLKRRSSSGWFERASLAATDTPEDPARIHSSHCFLQWGTVAHHELIKSCSLRLNITCAFRCLNREKSSHKNVKGMTAKRVYSDAAPPTLLCSLVFG